ncbi:MAG: hypothetical protein ISR91_07215 [Candidatus Delongbacteria bacterium]|nr:hypothetical protein [Candidatus Delongbacteria bacterium]
MPEYKLLARSGEGSQVFRKEDRLLLAMGNILLPLDPGRMRQLFRVSKRIRKNFDKYQRDRCVLINYEMVAFRFSRAQLEEFILLLDTAISNTDNGEPATLYPNQQDTPASTALPAIPQPPDLPLYSRN